MPQNIEQFIVFKHQLGPKRDFFHSGFFNCRISGPGDEMVSKTTDVHRYLAELGYSNELIKL
jgi:hypothetical protein